MENTNDIQLPTQMQIRLDKTTFIINMCYQEKSISESVVDKIERLIKDEISNNFN